MRRVKIEILCDNPQHISEVEAVVEIPMSMVRGKEKLVAVCGDCEGSIISMMKMLYDAAPAASEEPKRRPGRPPRVKPETGRFLCPHCDKTYKARQGLGSHLRRTHGISLRSVP